MKVSIITTIYNEEEGIEKFIESINRQSTQPNEIVIVDGGSSDNSLNIIKQKLNPNISKKIIVDNSCNRSNTPGPIAKGRNRAIAEASNEIILATDAGCKLDENWVEKMKHPFIKCSADVVAGVYKAEPGNEFQNSLAATFCPSIDKIDPTRFLPSSRSIAFERSLWEKVGGYPESSFAGEDTRYALLLKKHCKKWVFQPEAIVFWTLPKDNEELKNKLIEYAKGDAHFSQDKTKYFLRLLYIILFPLSLPYTFTKRKPLITYKIYFYQILGYIRGYIEANAKHK